MLVLLYTLNMFCSELMPCFKYCYFRFQFNYIMSKLITCQTVVSDPSCFGVLDVGVVALEEERPKEAFEPPPAREWQPDDVL